MAHTNRAHITENDLIFEYKLFVGAHGRRWLVECPQEYITYSFGKWVRSIDLPVWLHVWVHRRWSSRLRVFNGPSQWSSELKQTKKKKSEANYDDVDVVDDDDRNSKEQRALWSVSKI